MKFTLCKKQYLYLALAVISMILAVASHAFAQDAMPATNSSSDAPPNGAPVDQIGDAREERREERRAERAEVREERKAALQEQAQNRIINLARNVSGKMDSASNRMEQIITRIDARMVILKGRGVDTTQAEIPLSSAKNSLKSIEDMLSSLDSSIVIAITSENPRETFKTTKFQFSVVREALRNTHTYLKETITLLKEAVKASELPTGGASDAVQNAQSLENNAPATATSN